MYQCQIMVCVCMCVCMRVRACTHTCMCPSCRAMVVCAWGESGACGMDKCLGNEVQASMYIEQTVPCTVVPVKCQCHVYLELCVCVCVCVCVCGVHAWCVRACVCACVRVVCIQMYVHRVHREIAVPLDIGLVFKTHNKAELQKEVPHYEEARVMHCRCSMFPPTRRQQWWTPWVQETPSTAVSSTNWRPESHSSTLCSLPARWLDSSVVSMDMKVSKKLYFNNNPHHA